MKQVNKIVLLSDENTSKVGLNFIERTEKLLEERGFAVYSLRIRPMQDIADAIYQFDRIDLEIKPDLLIVADFACIKMQCPEEEPFYNNMAIPVVHVLFRRPWEYEVFMIWRCNFINRCYCLVPEDVEHILTYYRRVPNVKKLQEGLWDAEPRAVCYGEHTRQELEEKYELLPDYMKTIAKRWMAIMRRKEGMSEEVGVKQCLQEIGFACNEAEYLDILYMMQSVFPLYYKECHRNEEGGALFTIQEEIMHRQLEEILQIEFEVTLL